MASVSPPAPAGNAELFRRLGLWGPQQHPAFERIARLAARSLDCTVGLVTLVSSEGQWNKGRFGLATPFLPDAVSMCARLMMSQTLQQVPDLSADPRFDSNPLVLGPPHARFYAGQPIVFKGESLGSVCVLHPQPRTLRPIDRATLDDLACLTVLVLDNLERQIETDHACARATDFANASGDWFWELDDQLRYAWLSPNFHEQTGIAPEQVLRRQVGDSPVLPLVRGEPPQRLFDLLGRHESFAGIVVELSMAGQSRLMSLNGLARHDEDGHFIGYRGSARDVTRQLAQAREAEQTALERERAVQAYEAKSEFLSRASHELRTPLNAILGFSQLLLLEAGAGLPPPLRDRIEAIHGAGNHLLMLIDDVLDLSRLEAGPPVELEPLELGTVVQETLVLLGESIERAGLQVRHTLPPGCWILGQPSALRRVLVNVLSNAVKYNRPGGGLRVEAAVDGERVHAAVADSGIGIDAEGQRRLFEPFNRLGAERSGIGGTGLGLVIARGLMQAMGGDLHLDSLPGIGTTVHLDFVAAAPPSH
jgi:signal transduction histidine kinase